MAPKKTATGRVPQALEPAKTGFLNLALETRNEIYTYWAQDIHHFGIRARGKAHTTASSPITRLSHLLHKEFCGMLAQAAAARGQHIKVQVIDLDLYPLTTFLSRVKNSPRGNYQDFKTFGGRELIIELTFTDDFWKSLSAEGVAKWFRYQARSASGLEYTMRVVEVADAAKTREVLDGMTSGRDPSENWMEIAEKFREWEQWDPGVQQARWASMMPKPKTAQELAVDEYYNEIYAQMDRDRVKVEESAAVDEPSGDEVEIKREADVE